MSAPTCSRGLLAAALLPLLLSVAAACPVCGTETGRLVRAGIWRAGARRQARWSGKSFVGALFFGWGLFNFVEGVIDHHLLYLHHVVERYGQAGFDYAFLASGIIFIVGGWISVRSGRADSAG
jgi:uncharacterized membrane protein